MKIVILSVWYSEKMGYIENCLPKALAKQGHEVHVITSIAQVYYNEPNYSKIYEPYIGQNFQNEGAKSIDGYKLHRLPTGFVSGKIYLKKLKNKLKDIRPDVVQVFDGFSFLTLQGAYYKIIFGYKFFTANHTVASVFPLYLDKKNSISYKILFFFTRTIPGKIISLVTSRCYPATSDALEIAVNYYGVSKEKAKLAPLGVDTDFFHPFELTEENENKRYAFRKKIGFLDSDIVCIYTGRYTEGKNPLCLASAIEKLVDLGLPFKGLFMGNGPQLVDIEQKRGCFIHNFVPYHELAFFYNIVEIGVWPRQESTSMLDAAACGIPIVISNRVQATERVEGNGLTYIENSVEDLINVLMKLKDKTIRTELGNEGVRKIRTNYSWDKIAKERVKDYNLFLKK